MPQPPERENKALTWPNWPLKMRTSSSQEEGCERDFAVATRRAIGSDGRIEALECVRLEWTHGADGRLRMTPIPGSEFMLKADLVLLAMGFLGPHRDGLLEQAEVALDARGASRPTPTTTRPRPVKIFACGDMRRGQSLVVWAIREGRQCARAVDAAPDGRRASCRGSFTGPAATRAGRTPLYVRLGRRCFAAGPRKSRRISWAALWPGAPVTPPPGWVPEPHM